MPEQHDTTNPAKRAVALSIVAAFIGLSSALLVPAGPAAQTQSIGKQTDERPVVGAKCQQCHKEVVQSFAKDVHGKSAKFLTDARAASCESCHGDGEKHIQSLEAKDIVNPPRLTTAQANESCLQCHARDRSHNAWRGGPHDRNDMSCLTCHSAHHAKSAERMLTSLTTEDTCLRCHTNIRKALYQRSTHLIRTEQRVMKVNCSSCHNPHGGEGRKMLQTRAINDTCYQCHAEKRGPVLWEHAPAQENCLTCHTPHGSNNASLLTKRSHQLCQQCHINIIGRHMTVAGFDVFTFNKGCVNCHTQIHGSNHPAGKAFTR